ncbi:MAG: TldD/PmbA family protein [Clostridia bacterium]|nr:TldD/PmbA family protein [Clostridia bacterium]
MNFDNLKKALAEAAEAAGVLEYEIYYSSSSETSVGGLNKEINSFSSGVSGGICLRLIADGKMGYASTELMEEGEMHELVVRALENAKNTDKPCDVGLFAGLESYEEPKMKKFEPVSAAKLKSVTLDVMNETYASSDKVTDGTEANAVSASFSVALVNSHGLDLRNECGINVVVAQSVVSDKGETQADYSIAAYDEKTDIKALAKEATEGALAQIGAGLVETGKYDVIIDGKQMRSILSAFSPSFSAKNAQMGMSLLRGKEGEKIASDIVTIIDDPQREGSSVGTTFDAEGVATHKKCVVEKGVLKTLLHNRETAKIAGCESTANASKPSYASPVGISPYAFSIEAGTLSEKELFEKAGEGIFVTELKGLHAGANAVTGDFSIESAGFMIRGGKLAEAVKSFTIAGNFFELLKSISALSSEVKFSVSGGITSFGSPSVLIPEMSVAGK